MVQLHESFASAVDHFSRALLLDAAVRSVVFLGLVALAVLGMRRASAATRHWAWLLGFVGLLLLPVTAAAVPGWRVLPRRGAWSLAAAGPASMPDVESTSQRSRPSAGGPHPELPTSGLRPIGSPAGGLRRPVDQVVPLAPAIVGRHPAGPTASRPAALTWAGRATLAWLAGTSWHLGRLVLGYAGLRRLRSECVSIDEGECRDQLDRACGVIGVRRKVQLLAGPRHLMPMTWGLWHARVLLPTEAADWEPTRLDNVLLHELGHVRRFDCATQLVAQLACAAYWFNPLVWLAWHRLRAERERACDDVVLNAGTAATAYARHLVQCAAGLPRHPFTLPALAMARPSTLELRLRTLLEPGRHRAPLGRRSAWATLLLLLAALAPVAVLHAQDAKPAPKRADRVVSTRPTTQPGGTALRGHAGGFGVTGDEPPVMGVGPTCAFGATIYELRIPPDKIGLLDATALDAAAATPAGFEKALADLGTSRPLYHTDQTVRLASDTIMIGTQVPIVTNSQVTARGQVINTVRYQSIGAGFSIAGRMAGPDKIECDLKIELSALSDKQPKDVIGKTLFRSATLSHNGVAHPNKPFVVLSADAANTDDDGKALVYVAKVTFGTPE